MLQNKKLYQLILSAVLAIAFIKFYLSQKEEAIATAYGMNEVLVASRDIAPRTELSEGYLETMRVPLKYVAPGAIMVKIPDEAYNRIRGKITVAPMPKGTQIVQAYLTDPSAKDKGVAPLIPPGKRGYLLRLGNLDVANLILPGDYIDLMATFTVRKNDEASKVTSTILQNILVVSVGRELKKSNEDVSGKSEGVETLVLTLALAPSEAQNLALAQAEAQDELSVTVRPHGESTIRQIPGITPNTLLGMPQAAPPVPLSK